MVDCAKLSGFCLLMKRAVTESIGGLDERFGLGFFDDDDLALRARRAGFELAVAHDLFVHHFGSRTFVGNGIDAEALLRENQRRFAAKWGQDVPRGRPVALRPWSPAPPPPVMTNPIGETIGTRTTKVSLTMIVRDEQENLPRCLASVPGIFDEIVVIDTGSTDRTREIAREFGARVFEFAWIDDFAAARNEALSHATGDYAFWLDADDVVEPAERDKLRALLDGLGSGEPAGYVVRCACDPGTDGSGGATVVDHVRLFPIRDDLRWTYRVHEQIMPALRRAGIPVRWTDLVVRHTGYVNLALRGRKLDRDARILRDELKSRPDDPFILFNLGAIAIERRDWGEALKHLRRSLSRSAPSDSITRKLFALIARSHQMLGDTGTALRVCAEGLSLDPDDAELWHRKAVVHRGRGESAEAEPCWRRILTLSRPERFSSLDQGIYGHLTRRNLAALAAERGDPDEAVRLWRSVLAECPGDAEALARLERLRHVSTKPAGRRAIGAWDNHRRSKKQCPGHKTGLRPGVAPWCSRRTPLRAMEIGAARIELSSGIGGHPLQSAGGWRIRFIRSSPIRSNRTLPFGSSRRSSSPTVPHFIEKPWTGDIGKNTSREPHLLVNQVTSLRESRPVPPGLFSTP